MKEKVFFVIRLILGGVFLFSGFLKLTQPHQNFLAVINTFQIVVGPPAEFIALTMPWVEFFLGLFLVLGLWTGISLAGLWFLNTLFVGVLASAILRKLPIENCGCFGEGMSLSIPQMLILDVCLWWVFLALLLNLEAGRFLSLDRWARNK